MAPTSTNPPGSDPGQMPPTYCMPRIRAATKQDAEHLCRLVNIAGEGLPEHFWRQMTDSGNDPWWIGRERAQREDGSFSYRNASLLETGDEVEAGLIGYALPESPESYDPSTLSPIVVPLVELENQAAGSWYINALATFESHRGKGYGNQLLKHAQNLCKEAGLDVLSLIVADTNANAIRLYEHHGFIRQSSRKAIKNGWEHPLESWILMVRRVTARQTCR